MARSHPPGFDQYFGVHTNETVLARMAARTAGLGSPATAAGSARVLDGHRAPMPGLAEVRPAAPLGSGRAVSSNNSSGAGSSSGLLAGAIVGWQSRSHAGD